MFCCAMETNHSRTGQQCLFHNIIGKLWRLVILDKYVNFEKLYVTLDPSYNPNDKAKDLNERFTLLEKNSVSSKHAVLTKAERYP